MGFRSTFVTQDYPIQWPAWLIDKYAQSVQFPASGNGPLHSICEAKAYDTWRDLTEDIQQAIDWSDAPKSVVLVFLHECGGVTRCQIEQDSIKWSEPAGWLETDGVEHNYCNGCSDL